MMRRAVLALAFLPLVAASASAQSCNFSISPIGFGGVDVIAGGTVDSVGTLAISCTGVPLTTIRVCPNIGAGSGGATASARMLLGPTTTLNYQLYQDAARTVVWGSYNWGFAGTPPTLDLSVGLGGTVSASVPIYGRVFGAQSTVPAGSYVSNFSGADTSFVYAELGSLLPCPNLLLPQTAQPTFSVAATVANNCLITAQDINFGTYGNLATNVDAIGGLTVTCTPGTSYAIGLNGGNANAAPAARKMVKGAESITYGLYRDAGYLQGWGDTIGSNTSAGTGSGVAQILTVYGRVPSQPTPSAGTYSDTVVVTVTY